jgi:cell division protein ZapB
MIAHSGILANPHSLTVAGAAQASGCFPSPVSRLTRLQADENLKAARTLAQARRAAKKSQTAFRTPAYRLTYQHFSNYSQRMENELNALEGKLAQLIQVSGKLRAENHQLRQELAHALSSNRQCSDKVESAKARLEKLLLTLPEEQT